MTEHSDAAPRSEGPPKPLDIVQEHLLDTEDFMMKSVESEFPFVSLLSQHLLRAGGKRLRVALTWIAAGFGGTSNAENVRKLAAAIELTHMATLHHDDIIDEADTRRGSPSVNANWTNTLAVLSGDYLFAKSSQLAAEVGGVVPLLLAKTIAALCEGQVKEIEATFKTDRSPEQYLEVIELKTARLLSAAAYLGATVAGADESTAQALEDYSKAFGIAFQVADDLLDFLGDAAETGKPLGTDLKEGVYTLPLLHAIQQRPELAELVKEDDALDRVISTMDELGSFAYARNVATKYADEARAALDDLPDIPEKRSLLSLVDYVIARMSVASAA